MKSLTAFSQVLLQDMGKWCGVSTTRDWETVARRVEHEGDSFLTITLAAYAKEFERALELGRVGNDQFSGFSRTGGLPRFLGGFLCLVFDAGTGILLDVPNIDAIRAIRQFTLAFAKINLPCSDEREKAAMSRYIECEKELDAIQPNLGALLPDFRRVARVLFGRVLSSVDSDVDQGVLLPKHGPGSTADRVLGNAKYDIQSWPLRLEPYLPAGEYVIPNWRYWPELQAVKLLEPGDEMPVKVISVPKTLKTPRIIAMEPVSMQYAQQAISRRIVEGIERDDNLSPLIGFSDQKPNQLLAQIGSRDGTLATLDLSEASDRVSNQLVLELFSDHGALTGAVQGSRSTHADVLGHGVVPLTKFASMGSALCFPVEAMVFLTIIALCWERRSGSRFTHHDVKLMASQVRVYGDDLIVPVDLARPVSEALEAYGLKVNASKSFSTGRFRESCGGDYYAGVWVTPIRVRELLPENLGQADRIASTVSLRNQLFRVGAEDSVEWLDRILHRILPVYPEIPLGHSGLGREAYAPQMELTRCKNLHKPLIRVCVVQATSPVSNLEGYPALMKFFLNRGDEPLSEDAFRRAGRARIVHIKTRRVPV